MIGDRCPHCGSEDYGRIGGEDAVDLPSVCLSCGYDTESGTSGVCPGGRHPFDTRRAGKAPRRGMCCDDCYDRIPRDLPGWPKWRSRMRSNFSLRPLNPGYYTGRDENRSIMAAASAWLAEHPRETSNP